MGELLHAALNAMALFCGTAHSPCDDFIHRNMMLLSVGMLLLCLGVAGVFAQYSMNPCAIPLVSLPRRTNRSRQARFLNISRRSFAPPRRRRRFFRPKRRSSAFCRAKSSSAACCGASCRWHRIFLREQSQVGLNLEGTYWTVASSISRKTMRTRPCPLAALRPHSI